MKIFVICSYLHMFEIFCVKMDEIVSNIATCMHLREGVYVSAVHSKFTLYSSRRSQIFVKLCLTVWF